MPTFAPSRFDHLVVLMLENRSFDNLCGYLYEHDQPKHFIPDTERVFRGVAGRDDLVNDDGRDPPTEYRVRQAPWEQPANMYAPYPNSGEFYEPNINRQVYGADTVSAGPAAALRTENLMCGFVQDYIRVAEESKKWCHPQPTRRRPFGDQLRWMPGPSWSTAHSRLRWPRRPGLATAAGRV